MLRPFGVTVVQYVALSVLPRRDGPTSAELARNSFVSAQTMLDVVATLEQRDLIARSPDPEHRRRLLISLTDEGRSVLDLAGPGVDAIEARMVSDLSADDAEQLRALLGRCRGRTVGPFPAATVRVRPSWVSAADILSGAGSTTRTTGHAWTSTTWAPSATRSA